MLMIADHHFIDTESLCATLWGPPRTVVLYRSEQAKSLGISIVGGKLDFSGPGNTIETCISGIFVKHVLPDSLAGRHSTLKTGDRILEVNGCNLRDATHDHAVDIIRSAASPIYFIVQSLLDPSTNNGSRTQIEENPLLQQYGHLDGELLSIEVKRTGAEMNEPLGLSLIGHRDPTKLAVFVCDVQPHSFLGRDGRIRPADQLLQVNLSLLLLPRSAHGDTPRWTMKFFWEKHIRPSRPSSNRFNPRRWISSSFGRTNEPLCFSIASLFNHRNPHGTEEMAMRSPYAFLQQHEPSLVSRSPTDLNESRDKDERQTSTSALPLVKQSIEKKESMTNKKSANPIPTPNDNKTNPADGANLHSITADLSSSLSNQAKNESLPRPSSLLTYGNAPQSNQQTSDVPLRSASEQRREERKTINGPVVSHIPIMSSSSSASSLVIPAPPVVAEPKVLTPTNQPESLYSNECSMQLDERSVWVGDPRTRPILIGQETLIEIDRGQSGLGLSVVGGSDTQLVRMLSSPLDCHITLLSSRLWSFMISTMVVPHKVTVDWWSGIKYSR